MNEKLISIPIPYIYPGAAAACGALYAYMTIPFQITIVSVEAAMPVDDAAATLDINDDGSGVITAIDISDASVPGSWKAVGYGGSNTAVTVAAGSVLSFDVNNGANGNGPIGVIWALVGEIAA